jgi:hypothetical protein
MDQAARNPAQRQRLAWCAKLPPALITPGRPAPSHSLERKQGASAILWGTRRWATTSRRRLRQARARLRYAFRAAATRLRRTPRFVLPRGALVAGCGNPPPAAREMEISAKSTASRISDRLRSRSCNIASASRTTSSALPYLPFSTARRINCSWSGLNRTSISQA